MRTTSRGYKVPASGERGSTFFPALEFNIDRMSAHSHNGSDSEFLTSKAVTKIPATISKDNWVHQGNGIYKQDVDLPAGLTLQDVSPQFRVGNEIISPKLQQVTASRFSIFSNDPNIDIQVFY